jgi:site-specific recombinase XerD
MFKALFRSPQTTLRHAQCPLAKERSAFLSHLASQGAARATLLGYASELLLITYRLGQKCGHPLLRSELANYARQWGKHQQRMGHAQSASFPTKHFLQVACAWWGYMGWLKEDASAKPRFEAQIETWASFLRSEERLAECTVYGYCWWITQLQAWLKQEKVSLRSLNLGQIDAFLKHLSTRGMGRRSLADSTSALRRFLRYAHQVGWCRRDLAPSIPSPHLFRHENLPGGPAWPDVQRLIAATNGSTAQDLRNRAILLLLSVYGLRCGEVTRLRLEDLDWSRGLMLVRRLKTGRVQEFPLTPALSQALQRYLHKARPHSAQPEVFLTLRAPFRRLSSGAIYEVTSSLFARLNIASPKRGPHALRHACATYLLNTGLPLKRVGDHLGHLDLSATQVYAKVDLAGLRAVATLDVGGLL